MKKVADRVRYLTKVEPRIDPNDLPVEDRAERTKAFIFAPSESTVTLLSTHEDWPKEDTDTILDALQPYDECPRNHKIKTLFASTPALQLILDNNSFKQVRNKMKNLMRKKQLSKKAKIEVNRISTLCKKKKKKKKKKPRCVTVTAYSRKKKN